MKKRESNLFKWRKLSRYYEKYWLIIFIFICCTGCMSCLAKDLDLENFFIFNFFWFIGLSIVLFIFDILSMIYYHKVNKLRKKLLKNKVKKK